VASPPVPESGSGSGSGSGPGPGSGSGSGSDAEFERGPLVVASVYGRPAAGAGDEGTDTPDAPFRRRISRRGVLSGLGVAAFLAAAGGTGAWLDRRRPTLPAYVTDAPEEVRRSYAFAADHPETLEYIPCYSGCVRTDGHASVLDCYIAGRDLFGRPRYDPHGADCPICTEVVGVVRRVWRDGRPLAEIRREVEAAFAHLAADATETEMPGEGHEAH
jgi:Protein of unknown function with PCYCGC motif